MKKSCLSTSYKTSLEVKNFQEINKFFRQFDTIEEIYDFIMSLNNIEEKIKIKIKGKFADLDLSLPSMSKIKENNIKLQIPQIELKESDLIVKICQEVKKIDVLESKINFLFYCLGKNEKDFDEYEKFKTNAIKSSIITIEDFNLVSNGIKQVLNKSIKNIKLLYRASRDGDLAVDFHSKCDGIENTVTFVKAKNGRRFGGVANKEWNYNDNSNDNNAFLFSIDNNECYYANDFIDKIVKHKKIRKVVRKSYKNKDQYTNFDSKSFGPCWGYDRKTGSYDLLIGNNCLSNSSSMTEQNTFYYNDNISALSGEYYFLVEDYETYELILD